MANSNIFNIGDVVNYSGNEGVVMDFDYDQSGQNEYLYVFNPNTPDSYDIVYSSNCRKVSPDAVNPRCMIAMQIAKFVNELPWKIT